MNFTPALDEMNKAKELLLDKSKTEQKIAAQVLKDLNDLEVLIRAEMERATPLWTESEFEKIGIRAAVEAVFKSAKFDPEILQKAERVSMPLVTFANRLPKSAPSKSKKDVEEKKSSNAAGSGGGAGSSSAATRQPSTSVGKTGKGMAERVERLEERVSELEEKVEGYKRLEKDMRRLERLITRNS